MRMRRFVYGAIIVSLVSLGALIWSCQMGGKKAPVTGAIARPGALTMIERPDLTIKKVSDVRELCIGTWAQGVLGDYVLQNSRIRVIVADIPRALGKAQSGGNIVDVADRKDNLDYFGQLYGRYTSGDIIPYKFSKAELRAEGYANGGAALVVSGEDMNRPGIHVTQEYILEPNASRLKIVTTVENNTTSTQEKMELGDEVEWGGVGVFVGGYGVNTRPGPFETESDWISGFIDDYSVGIAVARGKIQGRSVVNISEIVYNKTTVPQGGKVRFERYLVVADKNLSKISDFAYQLRREPFGFITGKVVDVMTNQGVADVDVRILTNRMGGKSLPARPFTRCYSNADGSFRMIVPVGSYFIDKSAFARQAERTPLSFEIPAGGTYVAEIKVSYESRLKYKIVDAATNEPIPAKMTFIAIPPTAFVDFGPPYKAQGTRNVYYSTKGEGSIPVPRGKYKIIVSRGIEYDTFEKEVTVALKEENVLEAKLHRVIDTKGYVSIDAGIRTNASYDCLVTKEDRVISAAGEGVDYIISGDSNVAVDLNPTIDELGLSRFIKAGIGKKIDFWKGNSLGEFYVYPLPAQGIAGEAVPPEIMAQEPTQFLNTLRRTYPGALIQVNRAIFPELGYFTKFGYSSSLAEIKNKTFSYNFDAIELVEGKRLGAVEKTVPLFFQLLMSGHACIPTGGSDARFVYGEEIGYPRTYVAVPEDDPAKLEEATIAGALRSGNILITNGPFVKFTVDGKPPGSLVTDTDGIIDCKLEVYAAPWVDAYSIYINKDGSFVKMIWQPASMGIRRYPKEGSTETGEFQLRAEKDLLVNVEVRGKKSLDPIVTPFSAGEGGGVLPYAVTAPIYIDANGNGKYDPPKLP
jgi:hypothetical protein